MWVAPDQPSGAYAFVTAETDGLPSARVDLQAGRRDRRPILRWSTPNIRGERRYSTRLQTFSGSMWNYVRLQALRPGRHTLRFTLEPYRGFRFDAVRIRPQTGLQATSQPPNALRLTADAPRRRPQGTVPVRLINVGKRPARRVRLELNYDGDCARARLSRVKSRPLGARRVRFFHIHYSRRDAKRCGAQVAASSDAGETLTDFALPARARREVAAPGRRGGGDDRARLLLLALGGPLAAALGAWALRARYIRALT